MNFKGDIIIIDPCYFVKKPDISDLVYPEYPIRDEKGIFIRKKEEELTDEDRQKLKKYRIDMDYYQTELENRDDWNRINDGMEILGFSNNYLSDLTFEDFSGKVFEEKEKKQIGTFYVDSGTIGVFLLKEVLKYNPDFLKGCAKNKFTIIKRFEGDIEIKRFYKNIQDKYEKDYGETIIIGKGNINFYTTGG